MCYQTIAVLFYASGGSHFQTLIQPVANVICSVNASNVDQTDLKGQKCRLRLKTLLAKIMKEDRMILSNSKHLTALDNSVTRMQKMLLKIGTEMQLHLEMNKLDAKVESLYWCARATLGNIWHLLRLVDKATHTKKNIFTWFCQRSWYYSLFYIELGSHLNISLLT